MQRLQVIIFVLFFISTGNIKATVYENKVYSSNIKTVQLFPKGTDLAMPILNMSSNETLELHFDDLSNKPKTFYYTVVQCHSDWTPTSMNVMEYVEGFTEANISGRNKK